MRILKTLLMLSLCIFFACSNQKSPLGAEVDSSNKVDNDASSLSKIQPTKVFRTPGVITIDGLEKDWKRAPKHKMRLEVNAETPSPIENNFDLSSYFKMLWDDENLYFFVRIQDQEINTPSVPIDRLYEKDGLEIYLDGNNSKNVAVGPPGAIPPDAYDSNDDFIRFIPGESNPLSAWGIINVSNFVFDVETTSDGYTVEIKMPFADLPDFDPQGGHVFGLEFQVNDNDNNQRQNFLKWASAIDESWFDPSLFGTAVLFDEMASE